MSDHKKIALITGASRAKGIGFELARQLANQGIRVLLTARDGVAAKERSAQLQAGGLDVFGLALDVTDAASVAAIPGLIERDFGHLDILVNNAAGMGPNGEQAATADLAIANQVMQTTLFGAWRTTEALLPLLRKSPHPRIVNVTSGAGSYGDPVFGLAVVSMLGPSYGVAKAALNALTVKFAVEEKANGILVNAVCPNFTATFEGAEKMGARPVSDGAASVAWAALLPDDGPTGGFFRDGKPIPW